MKKISTILIFILSLNTVKAQNDTVWTLQSCVDYALKNNLSVQQTQLDKASSLQDVKAAKWNFLPNVNASASQSYNFGSSIDVTGLRIASNFRSNNYGVNSSVTFFNGFSNVHTLKQAQINTQAQDEALQKMKNDISLNVVNAYLQILFAKEQVNIAVSQLNLTTEEVQRTSELVTGGVLPQGDLLNVKSTLATDNQNLITAKNSLAVASLQLAQLLQLSQSSIKVADVNVNNINQNILNNSIDAIYNKADASFPEIKLAELNISSTKEAISISQANYYPSLKLSYGFNTVYQHRQGFPDFRNYSDQLRDNLGNSIALSLNIPIFNRYQFRTNVDKTKIRMQKSQLSLATEKLNLRSSIETAYTDALAASKSYDAAIKSVNAQQLAFDYAQEKFKVGSINSFDFNQSKNSLFSAKSNLIKAKYDFVFKIKILEFYYGIPLVLR